jgi:hypothetical protein
VGRTGVSFSLGGPGLRPPKGHGRSGRTAGCGPQAGKGVSFWYHGLALPQCGTLLREAQAKEEDARLEALLLEGLTLGKDIPLTKEFWRALKAEARQLAQAHKARKRP